MRAADLAIRIRSRYQRMMAAGLCRRPMAMRNSGPLISFTFDDFPRSAIRVAGRILRQHGIRGTYYASLRLIGQQEATGLMFEEKDLEHLLDEGHELGCHTYDHFDAWETESDIFEDSVLKNRKELQRLCPGAEFHSLSYPKMPPRPSTKRRVERHFACCRSGGQRFNCKTVDANHLFAFFLERSRDDLEPIKAIIDANARSNGWLIFATHDVADEPSPYGCKPAFFEAAVRYAIASGAEVLPVVKAWEKVSLQGVVNGTVGGPAASFQTSISETLGLESPALRGESSQGNSLERVPKS